MVRSQRSPQTWLTIALASGLLIAGASVTQAQTFDHDFYLTDPSAIVVHPIGDPDLGEGIHWRLVNTGTDVDAYTISKVDDLPPGWMTGLCDSLQCPLGDSLETDPIIPGGEDPVWVDIYHGPNPGTGTVTLTIRSVSEPSDVTTVKMSLIAYVDHLFVDAYDGDAYEAFIQFAISARGSVYGTWKTEIAPLSDADLSPFEWVVYSTSSDLGAGTPAFPEAKFEEYLDGGGRVLFTGQNIGEDLDSFPAESFFDVYMHADLVSPSVVGTIVNGVGGDPIGDGLSFSIVGGTGAGNQTSPDGISALTGAQEFLHYSSGEAAGLYTATHPYKLIYLPFGIEGIDDLNARLLLVDRCLDWLEADFPTSVKPRGLTPLGLAVSAAPLPTAGEVTVSFSVPPGEAQPARLAIFDARGRKVREIDAGDRAPGAHSISWDGMDAGSSPVETGLYFYRLQVGSQEVTGKLVVRR